MPRIKTLAITALGVAAAGVSTTAFAVDNTLRGAPQLRLVDTKEAQLRFTTDRPVPRTDGGRLKIAIAFADGQRVTQIKPDGRHGYDYRYTGRVTSSKDLKVGTKYTVRFTFPGQDTLSRKVKVQPAADPE